MPKHTWNIIENPLGLFIIRGIVGTEKAGEQYGPFPDKPAAVKGLKRAIDPPTSRFDEKGNSMDEAR